MPEIYNTMRCSFIHYVTMTLFLRPLFPAKPGFTRTLQCIVTTLRDFDLVRVLTGPGLGLGLWAVGRTAIHGWAGVMYLG